MAYLPILTYHRLLAQDPTQRVDPKRISVSQNQFRRHLQWLKWLGYRTVRLEDYVKGLRQGEGRERGRAFAIAFDDGYEEVLTLALPILQEYGFTATVFAVPDQEHNQWDDGNAHLMNAEQLKTWVASGMDVGAHSSHHVHLTQVDLETAKREMRESKAMLEETLKRPVPLFAYPYGETNDGVDALAREAGFEAAFATDHAPRDHAANLYRLRRVVVFPRTTSWEILWKIQRWYPLYQDWK